MSNKQEAIALTRMRGATIQGVAPDLDVDAYMLRRWRRLLERYDEKTFPDQGQAKDGEMRRPNRESARVHKKRHSQGMRQCSSAQTSSEVPHVREAPYCRT
jgi:transposase-like protein